MERNIDIELVQQTISKCMLLAWSKIPEDMRGVFVGSKEEMVERNKASKTN